jgi:hypothetical protein
MPGAAFDLLFYFCFIFYPGQNFGRLSIPVLVLVSLTVQRQKRPDVQRLCTPTP